MNDRILIFVVLSLLIAACAPTKKFTKSDANAINRIMEQPPLSDHFTGIAIWDTNNEKWLYQRNAEKLFSPASNIKLLTLYATLQLIGDSIPLFEYYREGNVLHIRGNGNPAFLHPGFSDYHPDWNENSVFQNIDSIIIHERVMKNSRFGPGWSWDDYPYYFQAEISTLPLFGNSLWARWDSTQHLLHFYPDYVAQFADVEIEAQRDKISIKREEFANQFIIKISPSLKDSSIQSAPFFVDTYVQSRLVQDTFHVPVRYSYKQTPIKWMHFHNIPVDTILRKMMLESNNFIAEQLLLAASGKLSETLSSSETIDHIMRNNFPEYKNEIEWVDGSGLSRYNLLSPEFTIEVLNKLHDQLKEEGISYYFPVAGQSGTIKDWPVQNVQSNIFAKSGELRNHYNISGFLKTDGGRLLAFSIMNDNYLGTPAKIRPSIQKVLGFLKQSY